MLCVLSCKHEPLCDKDGICVKLKKYTFEDKVKVCITLINNSDQDYYIVGLNKLVFGLNVQKELNGVITDARFEFVSAPFGNAENSEYQTFEKADYTEERKKCNVENYGPLSHPGFQDTLALELLKYATDGMFLYCGNSLKDTIVILNQYIDCIFLPKHSVISDGYEVCMEKIDFDELFFQFIYPNNYRKDFFIKFNGNRKSFKTQLERSIINYPDTLFGYVLYNRPITSELLEITK